MLTRTIVIEVGSPLHSALIRSLENKRPFDIQYKPYDIVSVNREGNHLRVKFQSHHQAKSPE